MVALCRMFRMNVLRCGHLSFRSCTKGWCHCGFRCSTSASCAWLRARRIKAVGTWWNRCWWPTSTDAASICDRTPLLTVGVFCVQNTTWYLYTHTHTQPFYGSVDFVRDTPGEPVPEETFTHSHSSWSSIIPVCCLHLLRSVASPLFNPCALQSFSTISLQVFIGLPLGLARSTAASASPSTFNMSPK